MARMRVMRGELTSWPNTATVPLSDIIDPLVPNGLVYHVFRDIPEDSGLELTVLVNGEVLVSFELPWIMTRNFFGRKKHTYLAGGTPYDVEIRTLKQFRQDLGQGKPRILLDHAVADARGLLQSNSS
ncbi:hypothetical protein FHS96_005808 [Sphingomonas zeicaulis]|uniref:hypothetical protein n=1 Tax=Sphingomonas zeicaulis TaxID=1632740 RepID=UPI003D248653